MNNFARNKYVLEAAPAIWFEEFVPAINHFAGVKTNSAVDKEFYTADNYYSLIKDSAAMNYQSGWVLDTGDWIADHSSLYLAHYDASTKTYSVDSSATQYAQNFEGMYNYCRDWLVSRAAWLSSEMAEDYTPADNLIGDVNLDGKVNVFDATEIQKYSAELVTFTTVQAELGDVNGDGKIDVMDSTEIQKYIADLQSALG